MQLFILGKNSDDKGTQLEKLTGTLLKKLGYSNIVFNEVNAGADEKDVTAEYVQPSIGSSITYRVIVECKAYNKPINLPDWLKFLGKLFSAELDDNKVQGCFIALSGANGNVMGHFNAIQAKRKEIKLITGDHLIAALQTPYKLKAVDEILNLITAQTDKSIINTELCYYSDLIYWIITFKDNAFTLLSHDGKSIDAKEAAALHELIIKETDLLTYVDLQAENETLERSFQFIKFVTAIILDGKKPLNAAEILKICETNFSNHLEVISKEDIALALHNLLKNNIILKKGKTYHLLADEINRTREDLMKLYRMILAQDIKLMALKSDFYQNNINQDFFDVIVKLHRDIRVPAERVEQLINILKWSPSALSYAINIDPYMDEHRSKQWELTEVLEEADTTHFIREIYQRFIKDFQNPGFTAYLYQDCNVAELEITLSFKIKDKKKLLSEHTTTQRLGIFDFDNNGVKTPIIIDILKDQPEALEREGVNQEAVPPTKTRKKAVSNKK
jgi:hypothetical protein